MRLALRLKCALFMLVVVTSCDGAADQSAVAVPFDQAFETISRVRLQVQQDDPLGRVGDVVEWGGGLAVADRLGRNVKVFDRSGTLRMTLGREGDGPGEFRDPVGLAVVGNGDLAVLDYLKSLVTFFSPDGVYLSRFLLPGISASSMDPTPDGAGLVIAFQLILDAASGESDSSPVHIFDLDGTLIRSLGEYPEPLGIGETPFMGVVQAVADRNSYWGTIGRPYLSRSSLDGGESGGVGLQGIPTPDWSTAPQNPAEIEAWAPANVTALVGIIPTPDRIIVRLEGGDRRRGTERHEYVVLDHALVTQYQVLASDHLLTAADASDVFGITIEDDAEAYLITYRVIDTS